MNNFENNFLIFKITLNNEQIEFVIDALIDIEIFDYNFIDEKIASFVYDILKIFCIRFFRLKHLMCFDDQKIKSIIHAIYLVLIVQNHNEFTCFIFIININNHFIIFDKF